MDLFSGEGMRLRWNGLMIFLVEYYSDQWNQRLDLDWVLDSREVLMSEYLVFKD